MVTIAQESDSPFAAKPSLWPRVDQWVERAGEKLNPILVKEARQALKSRQFLITFSLLLICGWGWSMIGVAVQGQSVYYNPSGPPLLTGFYFILTVPLLLIVPFVAYRSLAAEREDGTYELLSITTLNSRQIVMGKLGSAVLQMVVFYSALSPCIAFTYLLRGVDILTIVFILLYLFLASLLFSAVGLLVATLTRARHIQVLLSVVLLIALVAGTITAMSWIAIFVFELGSFPTDQKEFWVAQFVILTFFLTLMALLILASAAQISFASDNRSTKLRVVMLIQQVMISSWMLYGWLMEPYEEVLLILLTISGLHWMVLGALMTGEWADLSPRVKRALPKSFLGRGFLTWFNPGSGTGYVFAITNLIAVILFSWVVALFSDVTGMSSNRFDYEFYLFGFVLCCYVTCYLGVGRLLILALRRYLYFGLMLPFLVHIILALLGFAIPLFIQAWFDDFSRMNYSILQLTNWGWTLAEIGDGGSNATANVVVPVLLGIASVVIFFVNLVFAAKEIEQTRQEAPQRVLEDEIALHPELSPDSQKPKSPWDADE